MTSGKRIMWPEVTNMAEENLMGLPKYRSAADIIDWFIPYGS